VGKGNLIMLVVLAGVLRCSSESRWGIEKRYTEDTSQVQKPYGIPVGKANRADAESLMQKMVP
jgi:hypothetical protein